MVTTNPFTTDNYIKAVDELKAVIAKQAAEIERLREHNKKMANVITDYCNEFIEEAPFYDEFWNALHQKESE